MLERKYRTACFIYRKLVPSPRSGTATPLSREMTLGSMVYANVKWLCEWLVIGQDGDVNGDDDDDGATETVIDLNGYRFIPTLKDEAFHPQRLLRV